MTTPRPQAANRPNEVDTSFWLWISAFLIGVVGLILSYPQVQEIKAQVMSQALAEDPTLDRATFESAMTVGFAFALGLLLLFLAMQIVFVFLMRGGRNWARIVMAVLGGVFLLFGLVGLLLGPTSGSGFSVLGLVQVLLVIGAIVMMFRPAANAWFQPPRPGF